MIRWTAAGAVEAPTAVQIRVAASFPGRVAAGVAPPSRDLSPDELAVNLRWFAKDRVGPRAAACDRAVLSAVPDPGGLLPTLAAARGWGIRRFTLHHLPGVGAAEAVLAAFDDVVIPVRTPDDAALLPRAKVTAVVPLERAVVAGLPALVAALRAARPAAIALSWPFPPGVPPPIAQAAAAIAGVAEGLESSGIPWGVKGLPACVLRDALPRAALLARVWRSRNRFHVDADHQKDAARLFFPELVRFAKPDRCRFCAATIRCDGVVAAWLEPGLTAALVPFDAALPPDAPAR